jgi:tetratricopeptide (TPR) repeat protein
MAYALQAENIEVLKETGRPFFGFGTSADMPPGEVAPVADAAKAAAAKAHLAKAIAAYQKAVKIAPQHLPSQLGLGWAHQQAGDKAAALEAYRKALKLAWAKEKEGVFGGSLTEEAGRYLLALLDKEKDAKDIAEVEGILKKVSEVPRAMTPVIIPLQPDAALEDLVNPQANVAFDLDGSGEQRRWGWITPKAGWLVHDPRGEGKITSGLQMFGGVTFWVLWQDGYQALAALDNNRDGMLRGEELSGMAIWRDVNSNGISELGEVSTLGAWKVSGLSCRGESHPSGIPFSPNGVEFSDRSTRPSYDWIAGEGLKKD